MKHKNDNFFIRILYNFVDRAGELEDDDEDGGAGDDERVIGHDPMDEGDNEDEEAIRRRRGDEGDPSRAEQRRLGGVRRNVALEAFIANRQARRQNRCEHSSKRVRI